MHFSNIQLTWGSMVVEDAATRFPRGAMGKITPRDRDCLIERPDVVDTRQYVEFADPRDADDDGTYAAARCRER